MLKLFAALLIILNHHYIIRYFDNPTELFSHLYLVKFLVTLAKSFFPRIISNTYKIRMKLVYSPAEEQ